MADNVLGLIATIDVTDLKAGLSQVKEAISQAKSQFETSTASLEKWQKSSEGVASKLKQLNTNLEAQKKAVEAYENEIKRVSEKEGDHSKQLEILQKKLQSAKNQVEKTKASIESYSQSFEKLKKKEDEENSANVKLNKSLEEQKKKVKELENQYKSAVLENGKYSKEAKNVASEVKKATKELEKQEKQVEELEKDYKKLTNTSESFSKVGKSILTSIAALGALFIGFISKLGQAAEKTEEFRQNQVRLKKVFSEVGLSVGETEKLYNRLFRVLGNDNSTSNALVFISQFAKSEEELNEWTNILIGTFAKFGNSLPTQELAKNINQAIKTKEVSGQFADVIKQGGGEVESFKNMLSLLTTEEEREQFILSYLKDDYAELAEEYEKNNKTILESNEANLKYQQSLAKIGELGSSVKVSLTNLKAQALDKLYPIIEKTINFISDNFNLIKNITIAITALGAALLTVGSSVKIFNGLVKAASAVQAVWNATMLGNPIGAIITSIGLLSLAIYELVKNWGKIKEIAISCWEAVKDIFNNFNEYFTNYTEAIKNRIFETWENIKNFFSNLAESIINIFSNCWENIKKAFTNPKEFFIELVNNIVDCFKELPGKIWELAKEAGQMLFDGVKQGWESVKAFFKGETVNANIKTTSTEEKTEKTTDGNNYEELIKRREEYNQEVKALIEKNNAEIEKLDSESLSAQLSEVEKFLSEKLNKLKACYTEEIKNAQGAEEQARIKTKYQNELQTIKAFYNLWESQSGKTNETIKNNINDFCSNLEYSVNKATESFQEVESQAKTTTSSFQDLFQDINNSVSKYASTFQGLWSDIMSTLNDYWDMQEEKIDTEWDKYEEEYEKRKELAESENEEELERIEEQYNDKIKLLEEQNEAELDENAKAYKEGLIDDKQYFLNKYSIMNKYNKKEEDAALEKDKAVEDSGTKLTNYLKQLEDEKLAKEQEMLEKKNEIARKQFYAQKANDIAQVWINAALAVIKAFADLGPIGGAIATAVIMGVAGAQTGIIASKEFTPYTELAEGGIVDKPMRALIGEDGKEAVLPLKNNTEWIAELAEQLNELQNKNFNLDNLKERENIYNNFETTNNYNYEQTINSPRSLTRREIYKDSRQLLSLKKYS